MKASVNGIELHYDVQGSGLPLVLTHGIGGSGDTWAATVAALRDRYRVITWDVRGFGRSSKPPGPYSAELWARDLAGLLDVIGVDRAYILGHSMGGVIAQRFALDFPERVAALILVSTSSQVNAKATEYWMQQADLIEQLGFAAYSERNRPAYTPEFLEAHPQQLEEDRRRVEMNETHAYAAGSRAVAAYNFTPELSRISAPTLIIQGLTDTRTPPGGSVIISRNIPGSRLVMLEETGHSPYSERPERFLEVLEEFLSHVEQEQAAV